MPKGEHQGSTRSHSTSPEEIQGQVDIIKRSVRDTFHALKKIDSRIDSLQKERAALKHDLIDLKEGRLDKILHRQEIDDISKETSIFLVEQKVEINGKTPSPWYVPYYVNFKDDSSRSGNNIIINNSITKIHAGGACKLDDGEVKYL